MSKQFEELSETITDTMENLEHISVFSRSGNTLENIMVYKTRVGLELSHLQGSELDIMAYCHEEWKYFTKTYPNVEPEILPSIKQLLRYDECVNFFSEENIEKRRIEKELSDLETLCRMQTNGFIFGVGVFLMVAHFVFAMFLIVTPYTFLGEVHSLLFLLWLILVFVGSEIDKIDAKKLFNQKKKELGYVD
jgi:hypothetical protein